MTAKRDSNLPAFVVLWRSAMRTPWERELNAGSVKELVATFLTERWVEQLLLFDTRVHRLGIPFALELRRFVYAERSCCPGSINIPK